MNTFLTCLAYFSVADMNRSMSTLFDTVFAVTYVHIDWLMIKQFTTFNYLSNDRMEVYCLNGGNSIVKSLFVSWTGSKCLLDGTFLNNPAVSS